MNNRIVVLDTETTGLNARTGDRIIEVGCVELINRQLTGNNFHTYINPERDSEDGALAVHGLTTEFLSDKPKFAEIANALLDYVKDADVIIHNAPFDLGFLNAELERLSLPRFNDQVENIVDTLLQAREMFPGKRNSLDALCDRLGISNSHRTFHGALLDAALLAEVYLAMTRGQDSLSMDIDIVQPTLDVNGGIELTAHADIIVLTATDEEITAHESILNGLDKQVKGKCVWRNMVSET
jgi:DNA polymerase III subunit epsilon